MHATILQPHVDSDRHGLTKCACGSPSWPEQRTGISDAQWWQATASALAEVFDPEQFPVADRVGRAAGEAHQAAHDPEHAYTFGLDRLIDGIATLIDTRIAPKTSPQRPAMS